jgi:hypothetical protein
MFECRLPAVVKAAEQKAEKAYVTFGHSNI